MSKEVSVNQKVTTLCSISGYRERESLKERSSCDAVYMLQGQLNMVHCLAEYCGYGALHRETVSDRLVVGPEG